VCPVALSLCNHTLHSLAKLLVHVGAMFTPQISSSRGIGVSVYFTEQVNFIERIKEDYGDNII